MKRWIRSASLSARILDRRSLGEVVGSPLVAHETADQGVVLRVGRVRRFGVQALVEAELRGVDRVGHQEAKRAEARCTN